MLLIRSRDVHLFFPLHNKCTQLYFYVLSTASRKSNFATYTCSKFRLVEHSTRIRDGKIQHRLLHQEYSFTITQRLSSTTHRKDRAVTQNALESPLLSQPRHALFPKETYGFKSTKNPPPIEELKDFEDDMLKMIQSVKFKQVNNPFLNKLKEETDRIKSEPKLLIAVDKTTTSTN